MKKRNIFLGLLLVVVFVVAFFCINYAMAYFNRPWDTGIVVIDGKEISLPISVEEFEAKTGLTVSDELQNFGFHAVEGKDLEWGQLEVFISGDEITGIKVISRDIYYVEDEYPGEFVKFPEGVSTNTDIATIEKEYSSGLLSPYVRKTTFTQSHVYFTEKFVGQDYDLTVTVSEHKSEKMNGELQIFTEIFYYVSGRGTDMVYD